MPCRVLNIHLECDTAKHLVLIRQLLRQPEAHCIVRARQTLLNRSDAFVIPQRIPWLGLSGALIPLIAASVVDGNAV